MEAEGDGFLYKQSRNFVGGHSLWRGRDFRIVVPYQLLGATDIFLLTTVIINLRLHYETVNWFKSMVDLTMSVGALLFSIMQMLMSKNIEELTKDVDKWWTYNHLQQETEQIRRRIEEKLTFIERYFSKCK